TKNGQALEQTVHGGGGDTVPRGFQELWRCGTEEHGLAASSLFCYTCENEHSNWNCLKTYKCEDHEKYCTTTYSAAGFGKDMGYRITKKCSADCPETNTDFGVVAISTKCCKTSLCNFSGANSVKLSYAVMFLGTVASLICVIRAGL
uniref:UPAR/Ly6 domain-containing protein n=1 Tax=Gallus gallus TaxID=9031 RepID=A0A8V0XRA0_CHICK